MAVPPQPMSSPSASSSASPEAIQTVTEEMMCSSLSEKSSSTPSTVNTGPLTPSTPRSETGERHVSEYPSTLSRQASVKSESSENKGDIVTPGTWSSSSTLATRSVSSASRDTEKERFKRAGGGTELSTTKAKLRELQLQREVRSTFVDSARHSTAGIFKASCSTDLLFLIDTTGSMSGHIQAAKDQVRSIIKDIKTAFLGEAEVRMALVGYKDHGDMPNVQSLDFTTSVDAVHNFLQGLTASGGGDLPENVLGGIRQALLLTWSHQTRCIIHIADAPAHGKILQNEPVVGDRYPEPRGEPHGLSHVDLLKEMLLKKINYALLRINNTTDRMAFTFFEAYTEAGAECNLHSSNKYYGESCEIKSSPYLKNGKLKPSTKGGLLFEESQLGTTFSDLRHLVVSMVTGSASRTAIRTTSSRTRSTSKRTWTEKTTNFGSIQEEGSEEMVLETVPALWHERDWFNETLMVEGFSPDVVVHDASTLDDMMAHDDNIMMSITELTIHKRKLPFAQGALRVATYARTGASTNRFVVKSFKRGGKKLAHLAEDMRCQALCKAFALDYNALLGEQHSLDFIVTTCLKGKSVDGGRDECMSLEPFIEGTYVKYNNNCGWVNKDIPDDRFNQLAQAFSHFTFERSKGRFLVSDLQGVGHILTDPVIHALDPERFKLADANLGKEGFKFFFATHACNNICARLGLKSCAPMIMSGKYYFRDSWLPIYNTVCCSNKLCGRILRLDNAKVSEMFPEYHWCDACWPQLSSSMLKQTCAALGPQHDFDVSQFFFESQGRSTPRRCPAHREMVEDTMSAVSRIRIKTAVIGDNFWAKLKAAKREKSMMSLRSR
jgi:Mg-chelatase subunit ChlD